MALDGEIQILNMDKAIGSKRLRISPKGEVKAKVSWKASFYEGIKIPPFRPNMSNGRNETIITS